MKTYRIFLASSKELKPEREKFILLISEENKRLLKKNILLEVEYWEDMDDSVSSSSKQDDYEAYLRESDICVVLFWTKMGKFTLREYTLAKKLFDETGRPRIYTYQKNIPATNASKADNDSKKQFLALFNKDGKERFPTEFENTDALINRFKKSLDKLVDEALARKPAHTLSTEMPGEPTFFIGRKDELKNIKQRLSNTSKLMLINAEGGIGKTSLAAKYWHDTLYDYEYNAWLFCESGIVNELKNLAPKLGVDLTQLLTEEEKTAALKAALQNIAHNFLLVLDNANTPEDIEKFNETFRGMPWHVLITSRCKDVLGKEQEYPIEHLPPPLARELFTKYYKEDGTDFEMLLDRLLDAIGYNTLLTELFAKNMIELKMRGETLTDALKQLETKGLFLEKRSFKINTDYLGNVHKKAATTDDVINMLYDFSKLAEEERYWLVNMSILPASQYNFLFLCDLFKQDKFEFNVLSVLANKGWLIKNEDGFRISPVIQQLVLIKHKQTLQDDSSSLIESLNKKLENDGAYIKNFNAAAPFAEVIPFITKHLMDHPFIDLAGLNYNACVYYTSIGELEKAFQSARSCSEICETIEDKNGLAIAYSRLGSINETMGNLDEALKYYRDYSKLKEELYKSDPHGVSFKNGLAISYQNLGNVSDKMGNLDEALKYYRDYSKLKGELYKSDPQDVSFKNGLAISYQNLGNVSDKMGNLDEALKYYRDYAKLEEELHRSYPQDVSFKNNLAISYSKLGDINDEMGNLEEALKYYRDDTKLTEELHKSYPQDVSFKNNLAISYQNLGDVSAKMGNPDEALKYYRGYAKLEEELHKSNPQNVSFKNSLAISYIKLAGILITSKKKEAIELYNKAKRLWQELADEHSAYKEFSDNLMLVNNKLAELGEG
jgi:tetratricopeptide (TPR) repeat protein